MDDGLDGTEHRLRNVQFNLAVLANGNGGTSGDSYGTSSISLAEDVPSNAALTASSVAIAPNDPTTSDVLTITGIFNDDEGDGESGTTMNGAQNGILQQPHRTHPAFNGHEQR